MKYIKPNLEKSEELVELINKKKNFKAKITCSLYSLRFANGNTITISKA